MDRRHRIAIHGKKPFTIRWFVSVHEGQEILSVSRRNNSNDYLWTKLGKRMLLISVCLIFPLARVEKKSKTKSCAKADLYTLQSQSPAGLQSTWAWCQAVKLRTMWPRQNQRPDISYHREMTNCHKNQRYVKRKVLWNATRWYFLVSWIYVTSLKKKNFLQKLKCQYSRKTASLGQS